MTPSHGGIRWNSLPISEASSLLPLRVASSRASITITCGLSAIGTGSFRGSANNQSKTVGRLVSTTILSSGKGSLSTQLISEREKRPAGIHTIAVAEAAEVIGNDLGPLVAQPSRQR